MTTEVEIDVNTINKPYWDGLKRGRLFFQACGCGNKWLAPSLHCPACLSTEIRWEQASGDATVVSWVVYHVAYNPAFKDKLPYNVAIVRLAEGPQMITNIEGDTGKLAVGAAVSLAVDVSLELPLAKFMI